eukprot:TRINITY_DN18251_c0_g1_i2.p1 TRINITY_DN18251_c0_g1~~TRINITY_DN18251_c0_g1_i2.p1  ORF type:complete len:474 (-),score=57.41 TRINITY_DN18251_c0_g1_i2:154-1575(-)
MLRDLILFGCLLALVQSDTQQIDDALIVDSECHDTSTCAVSALQLQAATKAAHEQWTAEEQDAQLPLSRTVGWRVEALYDGKWYKATIKHPANQEGVWKLHCDVDPKNIITSTPKIRPLLSMKTLIGSRVQVRYHKKWYNGVVVHPPDMEGIWHVQADVDRKGLITNSAHVRPIDEGPMPTPSYQSQHRPPAPPAAPAAAPSGANPWAKLMDPNVWKDPNALKKLMNPNMWNTPAPTHAYNPAPSAASSSGGACGRGIECKAGYQCHAIVFAHGGECKPVGTLNGEAEPCDRDSDCLPGLMCNQDSDPPMCDTATTPAPSESESAASSTKAKEIKWMHNPHYCLSSDGNRIGNGVRLQMWKCVGSSGQLWDLDSDGGSTRIRLHADPRYCVSVDGNHFRNGAKMQLWKCHDEERNQAFDNWAEDRCLGCGRLSPQPTNMNMCMVIDNNRAYNGAKVQMWKCASDDRYQSWQWY